MDESGDGQPGVSRVAQAVLKFSHPHDPVTMEVVVDHEARDRITGFAEMFSDAAGKQVSEGGVIEYAIDKLWSAWLEGQL